MAKAKPRNKKTTKRKSNKPAARVKSGIERKGVFPIVGIGASAGGFEALEQFIRNIPENSGFAFVIIQHLDPSHKGLLPELLQRYTKMDVLQISDGMKINPGRIYVIPPNKNLSVLKNRLYLFDTSETKGIRLPIDHFFRSLAEEKKEEGVAVILSGMGSDGALGIRSINEHGGLIFVQDPANAKFDGMPRSAIDTGVPSVVINAADIPGRIMESVNFRHTKLSAKQTDFHTENSLEKIILLLRDQTSHDFSSYKKNTLYRRIERRMGIHKIDKIASYARFLQENPAETEILFKELLIGVTNFFRDPDSWNYIRDKVFPEIISSAPPRHILRAWVPACSTGEEAFSLAIIFREAQAKQRTRKGVSLQIFATDIDGDAVERARKGYFGGNISADVSGARLNRFFTSDGSGYKASPEIREMIIFAQQNIIMDPPFTKLDFLSCRNLLIYLDQEQQKKLLRLFHYSLNGGGILMLGNAESISDQTNMFGAVHAKNRLYKKKETTVRHENILFQSSLAKQKPESTDKITAMKPTDNIQSLADKLLLQKYTPSAVLVNDKGDILYVSGRTGNFLEPASGKANWNVFAMLKEGLRDEIHNAFQKAVRQKKSNTIKNIKLLSNGGHSYVDVSLQYVSKPDELRGMFLIIFEEQSEVTDKTPDKKIKAPVRKIVELETELQRAKEELQSTLEEMQTSQEELKSTNEELQSTNEELQSTNEELTTSKEEMQSLNEELQTLNSELQSKVDDLSRSSNDMKNLLNSTDIATLFLDNDLNVRRFTTQASKIIKLIPGDVGRPVSDLSTDLLYSELLDDAREVLLTLKFSEKTVSSKTGKFYEVRIMPYRTIENKIDGLVITFTDITKSKIMSLELVETSRILRSMIKTSPGVIVCLSSSGNIMEFNTEAEKLFRKTRDEVVDKKFTDVFVRPELKKETDEKIFGFFSEHTNTPLETIINLSNGETFTVSWSLNKLFDDNGQITGVIAAARKILKE